MPVHLTPEIKENLIKKLVYHSEREVAEGQPRISVFSDKDPTSFELWTSMFNTRIKYVGRYPLIPVPKGYLPEEHGAFVDRLSHFIRDFIASRRLLGSHQFGIIDFGTKEDPKLHLVVTDRYLKIEEFGEWLTDRVGGKHILPRTDMKHREGCILGKRDDSQTTGVGPADPRSSSSGSSGQVPEGATGQETVPAGEKVRVAHESAPTVSSSGEETPGSSMTGYMADCSGESTTGAIPAGPQPEQVLGRSMLSFAIRRRVFEALGESVETSDSPETSCCGCFGKSAT